jgi:hypothetical protein
MRRVLFAIALVGAVVSVPAAPAGAVALDGGCEGAGRSVDADGNEIMTATAPSAEPGTSGNPVLVDYDGTVEYAGSGPLMVNHHWEVQVFGVTVKSGGSKNGSRQTSTAGVADVSDYLPFKITGVYYVSGGISGEGGACDGSAYVKLIGSPVGTIPWIVALGFIVVGLGLGYAALPKAKAPALVATGPGSPPIGPPPGPTPAPPVAEPATSAGLPSESPTPSEHAPFAEPEPTVEQPPTPSPPPPPPPPPADGDPA